VATLHIHYKPRQHAALDGLIRHLEANGMPTTVTGIRREHVESYIGARRALVKPASVSIEYRALAKFWAWAVEEDEVSDSPMRKMKAPTVPETPVPVISQDDFKALLKTAEGRVERKVILPVRFVPLVPGK